MYLDLYIELLVINLLCIYALYTYIYIVHLYIMHDDIVYFFTINYQCLWLIRHATYMDVEDVGMHDHKCVHMIARVCVCVQYVSLRCVIGDTLNGVNRWLCGFL